MGCMTGGHPWAELFKSGGAEGSWEVQPQGTACGVPVRESEEAGVAGLDSLRGAW